MGTLTNRVGLAKPARELIVQLRHRGHPEPVHEQGRGKSSPSLGPEQTRWGPRPLFMVLMLAANRNGPDVAKPTAQRWPYETAHLRLRRVSAPPI